MDYRQDKCKPSRFMKGLPSNDLTAVAVTEELPGSVAWGFVAVVDVQERKVLRIAYISASRYTESSLAQRTPGLAYLAQKRLFLIFPGMRGPACTVSTDHRLNRWAIAIGFLNCARGQRPRLRAHSKKSRARLQTFSGSAKI